MSDNLIRAFAAMNAGEALVPYQFDAGELQAHQVEVKVEYCGLCHSDVSIIQNDWKSSVYPAIPGHEIIGTITQLGSEAKGLKLVNVLALAGQLKAVNTVNHVYQGSKYNVRVGKRRPSWDTQAVLQIKSVQVGNGLFPSLMI